ncbi:EAL domain-containing protein [Eubacterium callanderi]
MAEGVETPAQTAFLKEARCDMVQGYVFSRPVPIPDFEALAFGAADSEKA